MQKTDRRCNKNEQQSLGELANQLKEVYGGDNGDNNQGKYTKSDPRESNAR